MSNPVPIRIGGLFRCCIKDIQENCTKTQEGSVHMYQYCGCHMKIVGGVWKWDQDPYIQKTLIKSQEGK